MCHIINGVPIGAKRLKCVAYTLIDVSIVHKSFDPHVWFYGFSLHLSCCHTFLNTHNLLLH